MLPQGRHPAVPCHTGVRMRYRAGMPANEPQGFSIDIGEILKHAVQTRLKEIKLKTSVIAKNVGYELRCADPIPYDIEYTRDLGYCAAQYLLDGGTAAMVSIQNGRFTPIPFKHMLDPATGRAKVRMVDTQSQSYQIARQYMIRLDEHDMKDPIAVGRYAAMTGLSPNAFTQRFEPVACANSER